MPQFVKTPLPDWAIFLQEVQVWKFGPGVQPKPAITNIVWYIYYWLFMFRVKVQESAKSKQFYEFSVKNPIKSWLIIARDISAD